jgi:hypothetical protein
MGIGLGRLSVPKVCDHLIKPIVTSNVRGNGPFLSFFFEFFPSCLRVYVGLDVPKPIIDKHYYCALNLTDAKLKCLLMCL